MPISRRELLKGGGAVAVGAVVVPQLTATVASANSPPPGTLPPGAGDNPPPHPRARNSVRQRTGKPGLQWTTYGWENPRNMNIPEDVWKANIDWFIKEFGPYGYDTIATDGWIEASQRINKSGYIISYNDEWTHDWSYWIKYLRDRGFKLSIYYNPFWITQSARDDRSVRVLGRPDIAVADLTADWDPFTKGKIYWLDPTRPGAKEYAQGYVKYFKGLGATRLRTDFVSWFETGWDQNLGQIQREHGRDAYIDLINWMDEAAGPDFELSLVLPNMYFHGVAERPHTDSFRIDDDAGAGGWSWLSGHRQSWQPHWTQWSNPFTGFTGWSDVNGPGLIGLDGDFLSSASFATDDERRTAVSLFTIAGSPICVYDLVDTSGSNAWVFENPEVIALNQQGLAGKPIYHSDHGFNWDTSSRDTERWVGQLPDGSWIVGLFNRSDGVATRSINFITELGLPNPVAVRDLWTHKDLGARTSYSAAFPAHGCALLKLTPPAGPRRFDAQLGGWSGRAIFDKELAGYTGTGYAADLNPDDDDHVDSAVSFAVDGGHGGRNSLALRYALTRGESADVTITVQSGSRVDEGRTQRLALRGRAGAWATQDTSVQLSSGRNLIIVTGTGRGAEIYLDYITVATANAS